VTRLSLKLHQPWAWGFIEAGAIASVRHVADAAGGRIRPAWNAEKPVDISGGGGSEGTFTDFDLPAAGYYNVRFTLPRGTGLEREYNLAEDESRQDIITLEVSPHEYLGWQQFAGSVRPHPYRPEGTQRPFKTGAKVPTWLDSAIDRGNERMQRLYNRAAPLPPPACFAVSITASPDAWQLVGRGIPPVAPPILWPAPQVDAEYAAWLPQMPDPGEAHGLIDRLRDPDPADPLQLRFPRWICFNSAGKTDLASVPWAWWGGERFDEEAIRFVYDRIRPNPVDRNSPGHLTMTLQDRRWFGLLEFLASGRLNLTAAMCENAVNKDDPQEALYAKRKGPLVAVAGAIVLVSSATDTDREQWDRWLQNLSDWFPGIPDGPILLGCRLLQRAKNLDDLMHVWTLLHTGIDRGIPFFSATVRMLDLALAQLADDIPPTEELRRFVARVATRVDPDQPFTVVRLSS
jgi:hypothetical protein